MPIIKSAKKQVKINKRNRARNLRYQATIKKTINAYYEEKDAKKKEKKLSLTFSVIDKASKIQLIHPNKAARMKSKLVKNSQRTIKKKRTKKLKTAKKK